jgi:hypothetical protein
MAPSSSPPPKRSRSCAQRTDTLAMAAGSCGGFSSLMSFSGFHRPAAQRAGRRVVAVPGGGGLSLIFGVTRIVNFAHGSFYMLGMYVAYTLVERLAGSLGFWPALLLARWPWRAGCAGRGAAAAAHLQGARAVPAAGHLCAGAGHQGRGAVAWGPKSCSARVRRGWRARSKSWAAVSLLRPAS